MQVTVVDYGCGNLGSIANMLRVIGHTSVVTSDASEIAKANKLILPGVGSFDSGMQRLRESGLVEVLQQKVIKEKTPVLGICLGMQLMTAGSEEGTTRGLGWINATTIRFDAAKAQSSIRVPHMGWNTVERKLKNGITTDQLDDDRFYFVHGFHLHNVPTHQIMFTTEYGYEFVSGIAHENIFGVQFHPEKSHRFGMRLLKNFVENI